MASCQAVSTYNVLEFDITGESFQEDGTVEVYKETCHVHGYGKSNCNDDCDFLFSYNRILAIN